MRLGNAHGHVHRYVWHMCGRVEDMLEGHAEGHGDGAWGWHVEGHAEVVGWGMLMTCGRTCVWCMCRTRGWHVDGMGDGEHVEDMWRTWGDMWMTCG